MPSNLHQIQLTYDQVQDRLMLNFSTQDLYEYRFWVTRRVVRGFWEILQQIAKDIPPEQMSKFNGPQAAQEQVKQEVQIAEANKYATRLTRRPFGEEPLLLCKISATPSEGNVHFHLEDFQGKSVDFAGDSFLALLLIQLIVRIMPKTEWDLPFK